MATSATEVRVKVQADETNQKMLKLQKLLQTGYVDDKGNKIPSAIQMMTMGYTKAVEFSGILASLLTAGSYSTDTFVLREQIITGIKQGVDDCSAALCELNEAAGLIKKALFEKRPDDLLNDANWVTAFRCEMDAAVKKINESLAVTGRSSGLLINLIPLMIDGQVKLEALGIMEDASKNIDTSAPLKTLLTTILDSLLHTCKSKLQRATKELEHSSNLAIKALVSLSSTYPNLSPKTQSKLSNSLEKARQMNPIALAISLTALASSMDESNPKFKETVKEAYNILLLGRQAVIDEKKYLEEVADEKSTPPQDKAALQRVIHDAQVAIDSGAAPIELVKQVLDSCDIAKSETVTFSTSAATLKGQTSSASASPTSSKEKQLEVAP